jgi:hypothetical protein
VELMMMLLRRILLGVLLLLVPGPGCGLIQTPSSTAEPTPEKTYAGLPRQSAAVMVWADWATRVEYNQIQADLAKALQERLEKKMAEKSDPKNGQPAPSQFLNPLSVVRYQKEHPEEVERVPIAELAPRLGVARVIYVELQSFSLRSPRSVMILQGNTTATLRILEIANGAATVAFEEPNITAQFPRDAPEGVAPSDKYNPRSIYVGAIDLLADRLAARFTN